MSTVRMGKAIVTLSDECKPFRLSPYRWTFSVSKQWGPFACDRHGDPLKNQPSGEILQEAYEHYLRSVAA